MNTQPLNQSTIETITDHGKTIVLVKTAHVSSQSVLDVQAAINHYKPDAVCVELDAQRAQAILNPNDWEKTDIVSIIKSKQSLYLLANLILSNYQKKIADDLNVALGAEMMEAIHIAQDQNIPLHFIDRNIQTTFSRIWNRLTLREKINLLTELVFSTFSNEQITEAQLEAMKESDMIEEALAQIQGKYTTIKTVLIDERDQYMAAKIKTAPGDVIVAIIGAAHAQGIKDYLHQSVNLQELDTVPPKKVTAKIAGWIIPITIVALIIATFSIDVSLGWQQIKTWVLLNGSFAAVGTALVLAHPLTILVAFVVAPISSLSPLLAVGWFTGLVEAFLNKPPVQDLQNVAKDFKSLKTIFKNKFIKILLVVIMANLFSSIATFLSSFQIIRNLLNFK